MNPSASGWIPKFLTLINKQQFIDSFKDDFHFYKELKNTGFLFGVSLKPLANQSLSKLKITTDEYTKINLFHSLLFTYFNKYPNTEIDEAINSIIEFYKTLEKGKISFLSKLSFTHSPTDILEHIFSARIQESNSVLKKTETTILPYTLLFLDVLAFRKYLISENDIKYYEHELESTIINYCFLALKAKKEKDNIDLQILEQIEDSTAYLTNQNHQNQFLNIKTLYKKSNFNHLEKEFIFDLCCLAIWNDKKLDETEFNFLQSLIKTLQLPENSIQENINFMCHFSKEHSKSITLFQNNNPLNQLYKQASSTVKLLIIRNKNRLSEELKESGELVKLLGHSTLRELTTEEKDKVKEQLLDICKTVPSLTIFLIPGGSLLLPLLVKYIPSLLPSSFQDNRIDNKNDD